MEPLTVVGSLLMSTKLFEMSEEQEKELLASMQSVPYMVIGGVEPLSPQARANLAWESLGKELGFKYMTVTASGKGQRFFYAEEVL